MDAIAGTREVEGGFWSERYQLEAQLEKIYQAEELYWQQRSCEKWLLQGDANTSFFHICANGRERKTRICALKSEEGIITDQTVIEKHIDAFYKKLFGVGELRGVHLGEDFWDPGEMIDAGDRELLEVPFSEKEVRAAIAGMKSNSAPCPNGFTGVFFKKLWGKISGVLLKMVRDFNNNNLDLKRLNFGVITLVPKL
jgi:hypothetical protein